MASAGQRVMCQNCQALREELADLKHALAAYESRYDPKWSLPGFPDLPLSPNHRFVLHVLYKRLGTFVNLQHVIDQRPQKSAIDLKNESASRSIVVHHLRKTLAGTGYTIKNAYGGGYRLSFAPLA